MSSDSSYLVKKRDLADIIRNPEKSAIEELLEDPGAVLAASLTDLFTTGPIALFTPGVRIAQAAFKGQAFRQLGREIRVLREKGKLPDDFADRKYGYQTWVELLSIIDEDTPDEERLDAVKAMFLACNKVNATDGEQILGYQLFQIAKRLTSNELLVLKAVFQVYKKGHSTPILSNTNYARWSEIVAEHLGHYLRSLVEHADDALVHNQLLSGRSPSGSDINPQNGRLTDLGLRFCQHIESYQIEKKAANEG